MLELPAWPIASATLDNMNELQVARLELVKDRTPAKNREDACGSPLLRRHAAQRLAQIEAIDAEMRKPAWREPEIMARFDVLSSFRHRRITAIAMPELGRIDSKQAAALADFAPIAATADSIAASGISAADAPSCRRPSTCSRAAQPGSPSK